MGLKRRLHGRVTESRFKLSQRVQHWSNRLSGQYGGDLITLNHPLGKTYCKVCRRFALHRTTAEHFASSALDTWDNFARLSVLRKAANSGCQVCGFLLEAVDACVEKRSIGGSAGLSRIFFKEEPASLRFCVQNRKGNAFDAAKTLYQFSIVCPQGIIYSAVACIDQD